MAGQVSRAWGALAGRQDALERRYGGRTFGPLGEEACLFGMRDWTTGGSYAYRVVPKSKVINRLGNFLGNFEMNPSAEFRAALQKAIGELKPPTGTDWRASLEAMRRSN